jgi:hypothetical protein
MAASEGTTGHVEKTARNFCGNFFWGDLREFSIAMQGRQGRAGTCRLIHGLTAMALTFLRKPHLAPLSPDRGEG